MFRITLPVFYRTAEMENAPEDVYFKFTDYDVKEVVFYDISALGIYTEDGKDYTTIHIPGTCFYSPMSIKEIDAKIMNAKSKFCLQ